MEMGESRERTREVEKESERERERDLKALPNSQFGEKGEGNCISIMRGGNPDKVVTAREALTATDGIGP